MTERSEARLARPRVREYLGDTLTPLAVHRRLRVESPWRFLFESVTGGDQVSRFSFVGVSPSEIFRVWDDRVEIERPAAEASSESISGPPLDTLRARLETVRTDREVLERIGLEGLPLVGGVVGYFGWDIVRHVESLPDKPKDLQGLPIALLARYDDVVVFDHARQRVLVLANEIEGERTAEQAEARLDELGSRLQSAGESGAVQLDEVPGKPAEVAPPSLSDEEYGAAVLRSKEYIAAGDIFQVVPARRFRVLEHVEPLALYRALRVINPSPYMVLLESPEVTLVGASPEMLVRRTGGRLETRPIAGTRPRGRDRAEDATLAEELLADPKERAEHVMLVDLGRNDLGRVARGGGVTIEEFMEVEYYSHVMHIVSSVVAEQREDSSALDALLACFPAGTLSGAPKIRAMEIIDELESESRGPYGGAIGYLSFNGDMDTCIAIRTLVVTGNETSITAGAGIVADSDPVAEAQETRDKVAALLAAVALARRLPEAGEVSGTGESP